MGYTHYWKFTSAPGRGKFSRAIDGCRAILEELDIIELGDAEGRENSEPEISERGITFNGIGSAGYEPFHIGLNDRAGDFGFCKTDRREYDAAVCVCLLVFKDVFGDGFIIETDGVVSSSDRCVADSGWKFAEKLFNAYRQMSGKPEIDNFSSWVD